MKKQLLAGLLSFFLLNTVSAQLCTGSLGDPVVHITFGNSSTPEGPLKPGVTNLIYTTRCPDDGQYSITSFSAGCFNNSWFTLYADHTGDPGGRAMLVNASVEPSDFYVDTVSGLCGNTVYELATWVSNVLRASACNFSGIKPNLTFRIETTAGKVLQKFDSGDIPSGVAIDWKQYGTFFTTPAGTGTVVLRITNNASGGCGNDLVLDDITFRPCGPNITAYADNNTTGSIDVCANDKKDFNFQAVYSNAFVDPVLQWQVSADSSRTWIDIAGEQSARFTRKATAAGTYKYRVVTAERANFVSTRCRIASNITTISVNPVPSGPTFTSVLGCMGTYNRIAVLQAPTFSYHWTGPNGFSADSSFIVFKPVLYSDSGLYKVITHTDKACTSTDSFYLSVFPGVKAIVNAGTNICEGTSLLLTASGGTTYKWTPANSLSDARISNPVASPVDTTLYTVVVTNAFGCNDSATVAVNVWKKALVNAGPDQKIFEGESIMLHGTISGTAIRFVWSPVLFMQNSNTLTPTVTPVDNTTYTLSGISDMGCGTVTDDVTITLYKKIRVPNVFSPNGDGINDTWIIPGLETYPESILRVYGRSGLPVFQARGNEHNWDGTYHGKPVPVDTYYYLLELGVGQPPVSGWILVIR